MVREPANPREMATGVPRNISKKSARNKNGMVMALLLGVRQFHGISRFIGQPQPGLFITQNANENLEKTNKHQDKTQRHNQVDMPLFDPKMAQVISTNVVRHQCVNPVIAGSGHQAGITQTNQHSNKTYQALNMSQRQLDQGINPDMTAHTYTVGDTEENQRSEERRVGKECRSRWAAYH